MKKIFIIGSNGFVGQHLTKYFKDNNVKFISIFRKKKKILIMNYLITLIVLNLIFIQKQTGKI